MPYWPYLWPAAYAMSAAVLRENWPPGAAALEIGAGIGLVGLAHRGRTARFLGENDAKIAALTTAEVNAAARKYLRFDTATTAIAGDFAKK